MGEPNHREPHGGAEAAVTGLGPPEAPEQLSRRVLTSTVWNYAGYIATLLTWFVLTPFMVSELGASAYGLFVVAGAVMGYGQLCELGLSSAVIRFVADLRERGTQEDVRSVVATAFVIAIVLAGLTTLVGFLVAPFAADLFQVPADERGTMQWLVVLAAASAGIAFPTGMLFAVLQGLQRFDLVNILQVTSTLLLAAFTVAALVAGLGVIWIVAAGIPVSLIVQVPAVVAIRRAAPDLHLASARPRRAMVGQLFSYSWTILVMHGASLINTRTDELVIAAMLPVARVTPYSLARRASEAPIFLTNQFTRVILPLAAQLGARSEHERLRAVLVTGTRVTLAAYLSCATAVVALGGPFLAAWVGEEYRSASSVLTLLAIAGAVYMSAWTAQSVLQGINRHRPGAFFAIIGAVLNLVLSIALIGPLGVEGVALATLISATVEAILLTGPYVMRVVEVGAGTVVRAVALPVLVPIIPAVAVIEGLSSLIAPSSILRIIAIGAFGFATYWTAHLAFRATAPERLLLNRGRSALASKLAGRRAALP